MRLACEHLENGVSPRAAHSPYIQTARGRPASRRIPSPPECLPRVYFERLAVGIVAFRYDFESIGRLVEVVRKAGGEVPPSFYPTALGDPSSDIDPFEIAREARASLGDRISSAFMWRNSFHSIWSIRVATRNHRDLETIAKLANHLSSLLTKNDNALIDALADRVALLPTGWTFGHVEKLLDGVAVAAVEKRNEIEEGGGLIAPLMGRVPASSNEPGVWDSVETPNDALMIGLRNAFADFFGDPRILQDEDREPCGPFVEFVREVRRVDGELVTASAVKKANDRVMGRSRDKTRET